jgi:PadR family transcriptional regulator, regulatory protein PadR
VATKRGKEQFRLLHPTLDLLIFRTLCSGRYTATSSPRLVELNSEEVLEVGQGWFYPASARLVKQKEISFEEGISESNLRAKFYRFTVEEGRKTVVEIR